MNYPSSGAAEAAFHCANGRGPKATPFNELKAWTLKHAPTTHWRSKPEGKHSDKCRAVNRLKS